MHRRNWWIARWRITRTLASETPRELASIRACLLAIESHDDDRAFSLLQTLHATPEFFIVEVRNGRLDRRQQIRPKLFEQAFSSLRVAAQVEHRHPARSQHERCELLRFTQAARP